MKIKLKKGRLLTAVLPVFAWLGALAAVAFLFLNQSEQVQLKGIVYYNEQVISSSETGYLSSIKVKLYQKVKAGEELAVLKEYTPARDKYPQHARPYRQREFSAVLSPRETEGSSSRDLPPRRKALQQ